MCFLCRKGLDGWEKGDDPLVEHVKHAPNCGWAILAAIEAEYPDYLAEDPKSKRMIDARKSTFVGRWPHEAKKGWKCKTKQVSLLFCNARFVQHSYTSMKTTACRGRLEVHTNLRVR